MANVLLVIHYRYGREDNIGATACIRFYDLESAENSITRLGDHMVSWLLITL